MMWLPDVHKSQREEREKMLKGASLYLGADDGDIKFPTNGRLSSNLV
jgi:hypothetical protein